MPNRVRFFFLMLTFLGGLLPTAVTCQQPDADPRGRINHIVVVYLENRSFDGLFRGFPGARSSATEPFAPQTDRDGRPYKNLPQVIRVDKRSKERKTSPDSRFPANLPNAPFLMDRYIAPNQIIPDMRHRFHANQWQIHGGKNDRFVAFTDSGAAPMGYSDASRLHMWDYARRFTLCDQFFMAAFGGSFLNHQWLIAAATPTYPDAPTELRIQNETDPAKFVDNIITSDGYAVNTIHPQWPTPLPPGSPRLLPLQSHPTIGDRLTEAGVSWKWYSSGWNAAVKDPAKAAGHEIAFQFHHQPFAYFKSCARGTTCFERNLRDRSDLLADLAANALPSVAFYKPGGNDNGHPGEGSLAAADKELAAIVEPIMASPAWKETVIIITWDENGGQWDHASPPVIDRWGPGNRVPAIIMSPFAKKGFVDHTTYDTTSILALIESRYHLKPLSKRDAEANNMKAAFEP